jgi:L-lactate dehydrogenase complex protein LldG
MQPGTGAWQPPLEDTLRVFERHARAGGAEVALCASRAEAAAVIGGIAALQGGRLVCAAGIKERYSPLVLALQRAGLEVEVAEEISGAVRAPSDVPGAGAQAERSSLAAALAVGAGLVQARGGVAETGSIVLADDALAPRLLGMLAEVCIALLPASAIMPSLDEAGALLAGLERAGHRYVSLVTGPSRTADIERVLTIGVQGPRALHIIVVME